MTQEPTNEELSEALRSIEGLPLGTQLIVRLAADRLNPPVVIADCCSDPDEGGWIEWSGGERPFIFKPGQIVETRHRSGNENVGADAMPWDWWYDATEDGRSGYWVHDDTFSNIIAYRIVKGAP